MSREKLELFLQDRLPADEAVKVLMHLDECDLCCKLLPDEPPQVVMEKLFADGEDETEISSEN